jgi:2-polyprenyl-6-methoxyphenol hydroxylase-like FAD-dependent oxidoreductase
VAEPEVHDVAIVGYGPVGCTLAILLAQLGRRVVVLERWPEPYHLPRAVHFDHEVGRILQSLGIGAELEAISEPADVYEWRNATGTTLLRFGGRGAAMSGWPGSSMFNQPALEGLLDECARGHDLIDVRRGVEVTGLVQGADGVTITGASSGGPVEVRASCAVGCDGANSTVRDLLALPVRDLGFFYDWLIVDVVLHEERAFDPINLQICDPARPSTAVSGGPGRRRWEFMRLPGESLDDLNDEAAAWRLLAPWDIHPANATLERHAVYTFQARWVERWRDRRVLLAGDAAHQMPPFAGQGMCSGIRDAANLAWKLDLVLSGAADDGLLDSYEQERMPSVCAAIDFSMELGKVICVADPEGAAARDAGMSAAVVDGELMKVADLPGAGVLFPQGRTADGRRMDDVVGVGWRLCTCGGDVDLGPDLADWFTGIGGRVVALDDPDGTYARWFTEQGAAVALQRPDFRVLHTAPDVQGAAALVEQLRAELSPEASR